MEIPTSKRLSSDKDTAFKLVPDATGFSGETDKTPQEIEEILERRRKIMPDYDRRLKDWLS